MTLLKALIFLSVLITPGSSFAVSEIACWRNPKLPFCPKTAPPSTPKRNDPLKDLLCIRRPELPFCAKRVEAVLAEKLELKPSVRTATDIICSILPEGHPNCEDYVRAESEPLEEMVMEAICFRKPHLALCDKFVKKYPFLKAQPVEPLQKEETELIIPVGIIDIPVELDATSSEEPQTDETVLQPTETLEDDILPVFSETREERSTNSEINLSGVKVSPISSVNSEDVKFCSDFEKQYHYFCPNIEKHPAYMQDQLRNSCPYYEKKCANFFGTENKNSQPVQKLPENKNSDVAETPKDRACLWDCEHCTVECKCNHYR